MAFHQGRAGIWATLACISFLVASGIAPAKADPAESTLDVIKKRGVLIAGVKNDFPPLAYVDENNQWVGVDVEMAEYVAKKLGVELRKEPVTSRTRIPMLVNGNVDFIVQLNPTRERAEVIDFTNPYFKAGISLLVHRDSGVKSLADLAGRKVGAVQGSADGPSVLGLQPDVELVSFQEPPNVYLALKQKTIDAYATSSILLYKMSKDDPEMMVVQPPFKPDPLVFGVRHNDSKWRLFLEEAIMDAWTDGTIATLHQKYIGTPVTYSLDVWPDYFK